MDTATFRTDFPEFADVIQYPDATINFWLMIATRMLDPTGTRWGNMLNVGLELFTAHNVVLEKFNTDAAGVGGWPGLNKGAISSETPGSVSISYDTNATMEKDAGHWNYTTYGTRFIHIARMMGAGPVQIGISVGIGGDVTNGSGQAWSGPPTFPGFLG